MDALYQEIFLPIQLIYAGTTPRCLPKNADEWHVIYTANHWSNEITMIDYVKKLIIPYVERQCQHLGCNNDQSALVLFDAFRGQCVEGVFKELENNNIFYVLVPANCTDKLQPLDLSVNKPAKDLSFNNDILRL